MATSADSFLLQRRKHPSQPKPCTGCGEPLEPRTDGARIAHMTIQEIATRFVEMIRAEYAPPSLEPRHYSHADQGILLDLVNAAGFESCGLVKKKIRGNYCDQDGSATGETFPINDTCPFTVQYFNDDFRIREDSRVQDHGRATGWLDSLVRNVFENRDQRTNDELIALVIKEVEAAMPMLPITLDGYGNLLKEYPAGDGVPHTRDPDEIRWQTGTHAVCGGFMELQPVSKEWRVIVCRQCYLRIYVPASIKTYGDLRQYCAKRIATEKTGMAPHEPTR